MASSTIGKGLSVPDAVAAFAPVPVLIAIREIFIAYPLLAFVGMGILGGACGWAFAVEQGLLDHVGGKAHAVFVFRRSILGGCLGVAVWLAWDAYGTVSLALGLLVTGIAGAFPMQACQFARRELISLMRHKPPGKRLP